MSHPLPIPHRALRGARRVAETSLKYLQRHPMPMEAHFKNSLVVTWAFEPAALERFLVPGLDLDTYTDAAGDRWAFAAVAMVDLDGLRVAGMPRRLSSTQVMTGYRVFCRMDRPRVGATGTTTMRGLRILGSHSNSMLSSVGANLTTRYHYRKVDAMVTSTDRRLRFLVTTPDGSADLDVAAQLDEDALPADTVFASAAHARRFAGPLPYTFSPDPDGIVVVKSDRTGWTPEPVAVDVTEATFFEHGPFAGVPKRLSNAFHVADLDYGWRAGELHRVDPA